jgi:tetratricopeptide (TPR) repeat protein
VDAGGQPRGQRLFRRAIELDPGLAQAYAWLSNAIVLAMVYFDADPREENLNEAVDIARKAVVLDERDALTHFACGRALLASKAYQDSLAALESAVELNPNLAMVYCGLGDSLAYEGRVSEAIPYFEKAIALSPYDPQRWSFYSYGALAHLQPASSVRPRVGAGNRTPVSLLAVPHRVAALGHLPGSGCRPPLRICGSGSDFRARSRASAFLYRNPEQLELPPGAAKAGLTEHSADD